MNWWIVVAEAFEIVRPRAPVVDTRPHTTDRNTIR
jgi:hypothetical protein